MAEQATRPRYQLFEGNYFPPVPTEWLDELLHRFNLRDSDVILATYPRSGTTWLQNILYMLKNREKLDAPMYSKMPFLIFPQYQTKEELLAKFPALKDMALLRSEFEGLPNPRVIKTHLAWNLVPKNPSCKYIYCYRNPKDVVVSFYHHTKGMFGFEGTFSDFVDVFLKGEVEFGSWSDHVVGWLGQKDDKNVYVLSFEELQTNFREKIEELAAFTGFGLTEQVFDLIAKESSFSAMKSNQFISEMKKGKEGDHAHVRKGAVGGWREVLTPDQSQAIDGMVEERLKGCSIRDKLVFELS